MYQISLDINDMPLILLSGTQYRTMQKHSREGVSASYALRKGRRKVSMGVNVHLIPSYMCTRLHRKLIQHV